MTGSPRRSTQLGCARVTIIGHSFAGGVELAFATRYPEHVRELVFADTLAAVARDRARRRSDAPSGASPLDGDARGRAVVRVHVSRRIRARSSEAAWFGFRSGRARDSERCIELGLRAHVLWANRDSILTQADGREFADELDATFTVVKSPDGKPVDHDWVYRHPELFVDYVEQLDLFAMR